METAILLIVVLGATLMAAIAAIIWQLRIRPMLRWRYERKHFRNKRKN